MSARAVVVIPAYEAAATLGAVLAGIATTVPALPVVVVDDGSTDATETVAQAAGAMTVRHAENLGKGEALRTGMAAAFTAWPNTEAVVLLDADGQHDPVDIPAFLAALTTADLVLGRRARAGTAMPLVRRVANALSTRAISWCAGRPIHDGQCGMRAIRRALLDRVPFLGERYAAETDFVIRAARAQARIREVEIATRYGPASHFRPIRDALRVVGTIWALRPTRVPPCDSSAPTTMASSPTVSTASPAPPSRWGR